MSEPELPPTPGEAASSALAHSAKGMVASRFRRELRSRLPRFLWPLIPGQGGTVREAAGREAKRAVSRWVSGVLFSIFFFVVFGSLVCGVFAFVAATVGWAVFTG